ncbi:mannosyltransferase family protein [Phenylobacterium sp. LjRoot219]|uniref:mannosyltransferase family protein n=1 Tax=Phenylobacterium sp. LjRoot219 TaxID=3342283 RepID=UPI003ECD8A87
MSLALEESAAVTTPARGGPRAFLSRHKAVLYAFLASRLALFAVGLMTQIFIEPFSSQVSPLQLTDSAALRMWGQWDTGWYVTLATAGYAAEPGLDGQVNWAFFPAFPLLSAALAQLTGLPVFTAMLVVSNLSFLAALFLIHRFAQDEFDPRTADLTVALICAAPGSYIFSSAYTESLFLLGLSGCLLLLRARRWLAAGGFAALAVLTRNLGVGLLLPFAFAAAPGLWGLGRQVLAGRLESRRPFVSETLRVGVGMALPVLALAGFCLFLYARTGDPLAFVTAQQAWGRDLRIPFVRPLTPLIAGDLTASQVFSFAACWLSLSLVAALALMRRWSLFALAAFLTLAPMASGLTSYARYCLVALPLFLAGAKLLASRPAAAGAALVTFATLNGFLMVAWTLCMEVTA